MRKLSFYLFAAVAILTLATSCKKDKHEPVPVPPVAEIPDAYVGKWIIGNVNPAHFSDYNGTREDDMVNTIAYTIRKNGTAEQFIYIFEEDSNKQTLTLRKGNISFDEATATLKFNPSQGQYRIFKNGNLSEDAIDASGLYPSYAPKYKNVSIQEDNNTKFLVGTNDYNETVGFAKANW